MEVSDIYFDASYALAKSSLDQLSRIDSSMLDYPPRIELYSLQELYGTDRSSLN